MGLFSRSKKVQPASGSASSVRDDLVVPLMAGSEWLEANEALLAQTPGFPPEEFPASFTVVEGLHVWFAVDPGPTWEAVRKRDVETFGGPEALQVAAVGNLRLRGNISVMGRDGRYILTVPDEEDLSASLVLDPERWRHTLDIPGDLIVAVPRRTSVYLCSADDPDAVAELSARAEDVFQAGAGKPVTPALYRLSGTVLSLHS